MRVRNVASAPPDVVRLARRQRIMKVLVGLSGGVDSSVAAALLKEAGHEVTAFTLLLGHSEPDGVNRCCRPADIRDARAVADHLGISHHIWDYREMFEAEVVRPFVDAYARGVTPNPCGACNRGVRFGPVLERALRLGFDMLATGHYARAEGGELYRGLDTQKDQSYFLSRVDPAAFRHLIFPLSHLTKPRVRAIASEIGIPTSEKDESQEVCFVSGKVGEFLSSRLGARPGDIVDMSGRVLGRHEGLHHFTIGQRRGLDISGEHPMYVAAFDVAHNRVIVGSRADAMRDIVYAEDCRFFGDFRVEAERQITPWPRTGTDRHGQTQTQPVLTAQFRYRAEPIAVTIEECRETRMTIRASEPVFAPAPGQIAALYEGDRVVASGIIAA